METTYNDYSTAISRPGGGRTASPAYRESLVQCNDFTGLEANTDRYSLLLLVKKVGKLAGFTPRMIVLLDYYMAYTSSLDWEQGSRPIVFQSLSRTALDLGVSERQIQKLEAQLFKAGAITWNDSGNHKRYGQRDSETGRLLYAFGVDLTPLAYMREELEAKLHEKQLYDDAWLETKRSISWRRRQIRSLVQEIKLEQGADAASTYERRYDEIAVRLRTYLSLAQLRELLEAHVALHQELLALVEQGAAARNQQYSRTRPEECSPRDDAACVHYKYINQQSNSCSPADSAFKKSVGEPPEPSSRPPSHGVEHLRLSMVIEAAGDCIRVQLPAEPTWIDLIEAAASRRRELGISQACWGEACQTLGRTAAAVCLLITDRAIDREENAVRQPPAYFRGLVQRGREGELRLHSSVFGLLPNGSGD